MTTTVEPLTAIVWVWISGRPRCATAVTHAPGAPCGGGIVGVGLGVGLGLGLGLGSATSGRTRSAGAARGRSNRSRWNSRLPARPSASATGERACAGRLLHRVRDSNERCHDHGLATLITAPTMIMAALIWRRVRRCHRCDVACEAPVDTSPASSKRGLSSLSEDRMGSDTKYVYDFAEGNRTSRICSAARAPTWPR